MKAFFRTVLILLIIGGLGYGGYFLYKKYFAVSSNTDAFNAVPNDAILIIETKNLSLAWTTISESKLWQNLIKTSYFADINETILTVDKFLKKNAFADMLLNKRKLLMSAHMISGTDWDFLYIVDLQGAAKTFETFKSGLKLVDGFNYKTREYKSKNSVKLISYEIIELIDKASPKDIISICFMDNLLVVSFTGELIERVIDQKEDNHWEKNKFFMPVASGMNQNKLFQFYFNYNLLQKFAGTFLSESDETITMLGNSLEFSGLDIDLRNEALIFEGFTSLDSVSSYIKALSKVSPGKVRAHEIISDQAAAYVSINFNNYLDFYKKLMEQFAADNPKDAEEITETVELVEKLLGISVKDDFFGWIGSEIALAKLRPTNVKDRQEDIIVAINANNIENAKKGLGNIMKQIRKRTIVKFDIEPYKNFEINYLERKDFFKLFFGKLFNSIEKPYFTYIEDYVIFSNSPDLLKYTIDNYIMGKTLSHRPEFENFKDEFDVKSNLNLFIQMPKIYTLLFHYATAENKKGITENKELLLSFARFGFQLSSDGEMFRTKIIAQYDENAPFDDELEKIENTATVETFNSEMDSLDFKIQLMPENITSDGTMKCFQADSTTLKFEGTISNKQMNGIWRSYYPNGNLKSAVNYKDGKVDGIAYFYYENKKDGKKAEVKFKNEKIVDTYHEFYENGARKANIKYDDGVIHGDAEYFYETGSVKMKGEYKKGQKVGKWLIYDENGEVITKEKWRKGQQKKSKNLS